MTAEIINVSTGGVNACSGSGVLRAGALGSCVAVIAYDPHTKTGGLAHVMLPGRAPEGKRSGNTRYAADAIEMMFEEMHNLNADTSALRIYLVGGGNVLKKKDDGICEAIISSIMEILAQNNMHAAAQALGGTVRRSVSLDVSSGVVTYTEGDSEETLLGQEITQNHEKKGKAGHVSQ